MVATKTKPAADMVEVYLDCEFTNGPTLVGTLWHDRGQVRVEYHEVSAAFLARFGEGAYAGDSE